ncbi:hypothetical protein ASC80_13680 [Afipia sp. Root123D2]|nr:hypothetical protein ASC80_13680 [Afipia sp. Root123D2]
MFRVFQALSLPGIDVQRTASLRLPMPRQSIAPEMFLFMDARVEPAHDGQKMLVRKGNRRGYPEST